MQLLNNGITDVKMCTALNAIDKATVIPLPWYKTWLRQGQTSGVNIQVENVLKYLDVNKDFIDFIVVICIQILLFSSKV